MLSEEVRYRLMRLLEDCTNTSQRDIARELGVSLVRVNSCIHQLNCCAPHRMAMTTAAMF